MGILRQASGDDSGEVIALLEKGIRAWWSGYSDAMVMGFGHENAKEVGRKSMGTAVKDGTAEMMAREV